MGSESWLLSRSHQVSPRISPNATSSRRRYEAVLDKKRDGPFTGAHTLVIKHAVVFEILGAHLGQRGEEFLFGV